MMCVVGLFVMIAGCSSKSTNSDDDDDNDNGARGGSPTQISVGGPRNGLLRRATTGADCTDGPGPEDRHTVTHDVGAGIKVTFSYVPVK